MERIILTPSHKRMLESHARDCMPNESCAMLFGSIDGGDVKVSEIFLTENAEASMDRFSISSEQLMSAYDTAKKRNADVVGIFHSHPDSDARPSGTDLRFMQINPVVWVIYSGRGHTFKAFELDGDLAEVAIEWNNSA